MADRATHTATVFRTAGGCVVVAQTICGGARLYTPMASAWQAAREAAAARATSFEARLRAHA